MPTLDERIEAARKLEGYTPEPWTFETESGDWPDHSLIGSNGDPVLWWDFDLGFRHSTADAVLIAAAPDLHCLALDLAAERERLLATLRRIAGKGDQVYCRDGHEECALLARAALAPEPRA